MKQPVSGPTRVSNLSDLEITDIDDVKTKVLASTADHRAVLIRLALRYQPQKMYDGACAALRRQIKLVLRRRLHVRPGIVFPSGVQMKGHTKIDSSMALR